MPVQALTRIGGTASTTMATSVGRVAPPSTGSMSTVTGIAIAMTASEGSERPTLAKPAAAAAPRPVWPIASPAGSARSSAIASEMLAMSTCSRSRFGIPAWPAHWAGFVSQAAVAVTRFTPSPPATRARAHGVIRRWARTNRKSAPSARRIEGSAPAYISVRKLPRW